MNGPEQIIEAAETVARRKARGHPRLARAAGVLTVAAVGFFLHDAVQQVQAGTGSVFDAVMIPVWLLLIALNVWSGVRLESALHRLHDSSVGLVAAAGRAAVDVARRHP